MGVDNIDIFTAKKYGVKGGHSHGCLTEPVANMVIAYILMLARQLHTQNTEMHKGNWVKKRLSLQARILGVIGLRNIGKKVIEKATVLGMNFLGCDIKKIDDEFLNKYEIDFVHLN